MALIVVAYMFGLCRCFDRLMQWRIEEDKLANPQFPFPNVRLFLKKSKYKSVNSVTTEVFRGDYLILPGFKQTGVVCSCSLRLLAWSGISFMACASSISYATVTLCFLLPVIFFFCYWGNIIYFKPPWFDRKCHGITVRIYVADKVLVCTDQP